MTKSSDTPPWKQLELVCADIEAQLAPDAIIRHDHRVTGRSGGRRKIDISISQRIGTYQIFIIVDCKRHTKPVSRKDVAGFAEQVRDVRATLGVMISTSGFDSGAISVAADRNILLRKYTAIKALNWSSLLGSNAWLTLTDIGIKDEAIWTQINSDKIRATPDVLIFGYDATLLGTIRELWWDIWKSESALPRLGRIKINVSPTDGYFLYRNDRTQEFVAIDHILVEAEVRPYKYLVNLEFASGHIIDDVTKGETVLHRYESKAFDWEGIIESQDGIELTTEEYYAELCRSKTFNISNAKKHLRLVIDKKSEGP